MGKGKRVSEERDNNQSVQTVKKKGDRETNKWVTPLVTAIVVILIVGALALVLVSESGILLRSKVAVESENYKVTATQMQYAAMTTYQNFLNDYSGIIQYLGLDTSMPLSSQQYGEGTWLDYFMDPTKEAVEEYLIYAEAAKAAGVTLDEDEKKAIDDTIASIKTSAKSAGYSEKEFIKLLYGTGVNKSDIRAFTELSTLASKYQAQLTDEIKESITVDDATAYYNEKIDEYAIADVLTYKETLTVDATLSEEEREAKKAEFLAKFDAVGAATSEEEFRTALLAYLTDNAGEDDDETPEEKLEAALTTVNKSEVALADAADWLFALEDGKHTIAVGESKVFTDDEEETASESDSEDAPTDYDYTVTVYCVVKAPYADESATKNVGHILLSLDVHGTDEAAKAAADEVYAEYKAGEMTKESFEALGEEHTADGNVFYDNVLPGEMVAEFDAWIYDEARKEGDTDIVKTDYGYHIMYFVGDGDAQWLAECKSDLTSEEFTTKFEELTEKYTVTINDKAIASVKS